jgi:cytochrome b subunit of formate dehydrogenase
MRAKIKTRLKRFGPLQRLFHLLLMLCFLTQAATGLGRMFIETVWGRRITWFFGGYEASRTVHVYVGILMMVVFVAHIAYLLTRLNWKRIGESLTGPDSLMPLPKDFLDFFRHIAWFFGLREAPAFDRWTYWEKFDYWAVFWGIPLLGITGLLLAYPLWASGIMPGWGLNVAFWIHRIEAILAMGHVFIVHFFVAHLRPHNFPMDRAMAEGSTDLESVRHEKPLWVERLRKSGKLDESLVMEAPIGSRILFCLVGYAAVLFGVFLLIGGLINSRYITW